MHLKEGYYLFFSVINIIPGFNYDVLSNTLYGSARDKITEYNLKIIAVLREEDGSFKEFNIIVNANKVCDNGLYMHSFHFSSKSVDYGQYLTLQVTRSNGSKIIDIYENGMTKLPFSFSLCLSNDTYTVYTNSEFDYNFSISNDGFKVYEVAKELSTSTINVISLNTCIYILYYTYIYLFIDPVLPKFSYQNQNNTFFTGSTINLYVKKESSYIEYFNITPSLPFGLEFNSNDGTIYGLAYLLLNETEYTITSHNDKGKYEYKLFLSIIDSDIDKCENEGKIFFGIESLIGKYPERPSYKLINENNQIVYEKQQGSFDGSLNIWVECVPYGIYTLRMVDHSGLGWNDSYIVLVADGSAFGMYTIQNNDDSVVDIRIYCILLYYYY